MSREPYPLCQQIRKEIQFYIFYWSKSATGLQKTYKMDYWKDPKIDPIAIIFQIILSKEFSNFF